MHRIFTGAALAAAAFVAFGLAAPATAASGRPPVEAPIPDFARGVGAPNSEVLLVPGTGDPTGIDQMARNHGWWGDRTVRTVGYPASFGVDVGGFTVDLIGTGTYNRSKLGGVVNTIDAARASLRAGHPVVLSGYSQGSSIAMDAAYTLIHSGAAAPQDLTAVLGADPRFPHTGLDAVMPSMLPGAATDGPRRPADTAGMHVVSYCIRGDSVCGLANPLSDPAATALYFAPGYYIHAFMYPNIGNYRQIKQWHDGNTEYHVYDGGNPVGIMLRDIGIPVDKHFDDQLSAAVPVPMPGTAATRDGKQVPTPREQQEQLYRSWGWELPVTDSDNLDRQRERRSRPAPPSAPLPDLPPQITDILKGVLRATGQPAARR